MKITPELKDEDGSDLAGTCEERGFIIELNASNEIHPFPLAALETVLHEITHSVFYTSHITKGDTEERVCQSMGSVLTQIFRDNPKLIAWIEWALKT